MPEASDRTGAPSIHSRVFSHAETTIDPSLAAAPLASKPARYVFNLPASWTSAAMSALTDFSARASVSLPAASKALPALGNAH